MEQILKAINLSDISALGVTALAMILSLKFLPKFFSDARQRDFEIYQKLTKEIGYKVESLNKDLNDWRIKYYQLEAKCKLLEERCRSLEQRLYNGKG